MPQVNRAKRRYYSQRDVMRRRMQRTGGRGGGLTSEEVLVTFLTDSYLLDGQRGAHLYRSHLYESTNSAFYYQVDDGTLSTSEGFYGGVW